MIEKNDVFTLNRRNDLSFEPDTTCKLPSVSAPGITLLFVSVAEKTINVQKPSRDNCRADAFITLVR
jgi:hypothetical protein